MTKRFHRPLFILPAALVLLAALSLIGITAASSKQSPRAKAAATIPLADAKVIVEVNATDGDAGLQVFFDGEPWKSMTVSDPSRRTIIDIDAGFRLRDFGFTESFHESSEPPFDEFPLAEFKALFPEGKYTFSGTSVEGDRLVGEARLTHRFPQGPEITSPAEDATVNRGHLVARWNAVPENHGIDIVGYRAIVTRENPLRVYSVDLPASRTSVTIPGEFLESGTQYKLEVQAIEKGGNQTLTEITFSVR